MEILMFDASPRVVGGKKTDAGFTFIWKKGEKNFRTFES